MSIYVISYVNQTISYYYPAYTYIYIYICHVSILPAIYTIYHMSLRLLRGAFKGPSSFGISAAECSE